MGNLFSKTKKLPVLKIIYVEDQIFDTETILENHRDSKIHDLNLFYRIFLNENNNEISIYENIKNKYNIKKWFYKGKTISPSKVDPLILYTHFVKTIKYQKIFIPKVFNYNSRFFEIPLCEGNTRLLKISDNKYTLICKNKIETFKTTSEIIKFFSFNDIVKNLHSIAIDSDNIIYLLDEGIKFKGYFNESINEKFLHEYFCWFYNKNNIVFTKIDYL